MISSAYNVMDSVIPTKPPIYYTLINYNYNYNSRYLIYYRLVLLKGNTRLLRWEGDYY